MGGVLKYSDVIGVYFNKFKHGTTEIDKSVGNLPFHMLSTSIRNLAYIYFYLKCDIEEKSTFIIDEPEAYLHPENQVKMAQIIAMLVNAKVKVVITTHSDFFNS